MILEHLANGLASQEHTNVKYALRDSDPQLAQKPFADRARLCYTWDKQMVEWADVVVAEASYPSIGLGIELQIACARETPVLLAFKLEESHRAKPVRYQTVSHDTYELQLGDGFVSLMALGMPNIFKVLPYTDSADAFARVNASVQILRQPNDTEDN